MKDKHLWVGYLTLSNKKVLVASDARVDSANSKNMLLYNQERDEIVEYSREIIQPKLKAAPEADYDAGTMAAAFQKALRKKFPNLYRVIFTPGAGGAASRKKKSAPSYEAEEAVEVEMDASFDMDDDDVGEDDEDEAFEDKD